MAREDREGQPNVARRQARDEGGHLKATITVSGKGALIVRCLLNWNLVRIELTIAELDAASAVDVVRQLAAALTEPARQPDGGKP
jgi:hypothetical protein